MLNFSDQLSHLSNLGKNGCLQNAHLLPSNELKHLTWRQIEAAIEGQIQIENTTVSLCVGIDEQFPRSLPQIFLRPADAFGFIPHIDDDDGYICYVDTEGLLLNFENPAGILAEAIELAIAVLKDGFTGQNKWDIMDELAAYWQQLNPKDESLPTFIAVDKQIRKIFVYKNAKNYLLAADNINIPKAYYNNHNPNFFNSLKRHTALYIPLEDNTFVYPPRPNQGWNQRQIQEIIRQNLSVDNYEQLRYLARKSKSEELVILGFPRPKGGITLTGILFTSIKNGHPIVVEASESRPVPISIQRYDPHYLVQRGGGMNQLRNFNVLVVGSGSIGGYVVVNLAQVGITNLTLIDPDILKPENIFRHVLGKSAESQSKVTALKKEIEEKYPYLSVKTYQTNIEKALEKKLIELSTFDLVIFATGNQTVELFLNQLIHQHPQNPKAIFTWLEPYGIGGHTLLTRPNTSGCLHCLFSSNSISKDLFYNKSSFGADNQSFSKDDLGCGSSYTAYGALDAQKTAEQTVRLAVNTLLNKETKNPILSWKGFSDSFIAAGFKLSNRYQLTVEQLEENKYNYINPCCPVCGGQKA